MSAHANGHDMRTERPSRPPPAAPSSSKQVIEGYTILKTLGSGSFGKVKREFSCSSLPANMLGHIPCP
jgi:hypothetical protein